MDINNSLEKEVQKLDTQYKSNQEVAITEELADDIGKDFKSCLVQGIMVANLTYRLAKEMGFSEEEAYELKLAGMVHDIGKLRVSPYLYGRDSSSLLIEETKYKRMHPTISYELLKQYGFSDNISQTVHRHHECFDGSGYPDNLEGEQIPIGARILRIADEFVDLITDRPYRKAFDIDAAVDIMIEEIKNLDLKVFIVFQRLIHEEEILTMLKNSRICLNDLCIRDILDD